MRYRFNCRWLAVAARFVASLNIASLAFLPAGYAQSPSADADPSTAAAVDFPPELVHWSPRPDNPIFTAEGSSHWDVKIRERGWILRDGDAYQLWFTGYDGTRTGIKLLGYATSRDGVHWTRWPKNPIDHDHWVEDMCVVHRGDTYYMFAEGAAFNHAELLTSKNGIDWKWEGDLDVRLADGKRPAPRPCGTPTVWVENDVWYLFYELLDKGVLLATTKKPLTRVWTNVRDEPVLSPGPAEYDKDLIAVDQVIKYGGAYFAFYHGSGAVMPRTWNTDIARSTDLMHWRKYAGNPIVDENKSSGIVVSTTDPAVPGRAFRLYTMHDQIDLFESAPNPHQ